MHAIAKSLSTRRAAWAAFVLALAVSHAEPAAALPRYDPGEDFGRAIALGDFNGDGRDELVVGDPGFDDVDNYNNDIGAIRIYNSLPDSTAFHRVTLSTPGIPGFPEGGDRFGHALAVGDFDRDGFDDLVVGAPGHRGADTGSVCVIYGRSSGLQTFDRTTAHGPPGLDPGVTYAAPAPYGFGWSLAVGDFGGDAADDLAIGMPGREASGQPLSGAVFIRYGDIGVGTSAIDAQQFNQNSAGIPGAVGFGAFFGYALAAGELGRAIDKDDLAIGIPGHTVNGREDAGAVMVMFGTNTLLGSANIQHIHQDWGSAHGAAETDDSFGAALAIGGFDADSYDDLAVGVPDENVEGHDYAGLVNIMYGSSTGISSTRHFSLALNGPQEDEPGDFEYYGHALTVGDFNDNGYDDLAVGAPGDYYNQGDQEGSGGTVLVYYSSSNGSGLTKTNYQYWNREVFPISEGTLGGQSLAAGDFDDNGIEDLCMGSVSARNVVGLEAVRVTGLSTAGGFRVTR